MNSGLFKGKLNHWDLGEVNKTGCRVGAGWGRGSCRTKKEKKGWRHKGKERTSEEPGGGGRACIFSLTPQDYPLR